MSRRTGSARIGPAPRTQREARREGRTPFPVRGMPVRISEHHGAGRPAGRLHLAHDRRKCRRGADLPDAREGGSAPSPAGHGRPDILRRRQPRPQCPIEPGRGPGRNLPAGTGQTTGGKRAASGRLQARSPSFARKKPQMAANGGAKAALPAPFPPQAPGGGAHGPFSLSPARPDAAARPLSCAGSWRTDRPSAC